MKKQIKRIFAAVACAIIVLSAFCINSSALSAVTTESFDYSDSRVICIAHRGDWQSFPENSAQAIGAASEYDVISVDIGVTADSEIVLFADETIDRMCCD